jgi:hypothetical protein
MINDDIITTNNSSLTIIIKKVKFTNNIFKVEVNQEGVPPISILENIIDNKICVIGPTTVFSTFEINDNKLMQTYFGFLNGNSISGNALLTKHNIC